MTAAGAHALPQTTFFKHKTETAANKFQGGWCLIFGRGNSCWFWRVRLGLPRWFWALRLAGVNQRSGFVHAVTQQVGQGALRAVYARVQGFALVWCGFFQNPVGHFRLVTRVPNAYAQAPVVRRTQLCMDVSKTIVSGMSAAMLELDLSW